MRFQVNYKQGKRCW